MNKSHKRVIFHLFGEKPRLKRSASKIVQQVTSSTVSLVPSFKMKFAGVAILKGNEISISHCFLNKCLKNCRFITTCMARY